MLRAEGLYRVFERGGERVVAVDGVSFSIERPSLVALLGPNGAGKSTLLNMVAGVVPPTRGRVLVRGVDVWRDPHRAKKLMGFVPQEFGVVDMFTVEENMWYAADLYRVPRSEARRRIRELLELMGLEGHRRRLASKLSGGLRRRLSIAMSLVHDPPVLILDEPTTGLDPGMRAEFLSMLRRFVGEGRLVLMSTHIAEEAEVCDAVMVMHRGRLIAMGRPEELKRRVIGVGAVVEVVAEPRSRLGLLAEELSRFGGAEVRGGVVRAVVDSFERGVPAIVSLAQSKGLRVVEVRARRPTLYDVFLRLTGYDLGEERWGF